MKKKIWKKKKILDVQLWQMAKKQIVFFTDALCGGQLAVFP